MKVCELMVGFLASFYSCIFGDALVWAFKRNFTAFYAVCDIRLCEPFSLHRALLTQTELVQRSRRMRLRFVLSPSSVHDNINAER